VTIQCCHATIYQFNITHQKGGYSPERGDKGGWETDAAACDAVTKRAAASPSNADGGSPEDIS
jgi:hypothetical protein